MRAKKIVIFVTLVLTTLMAQAKTPVILDTDMAVDDWFAMLYLLNRPDVEVIGVTVTGTGEAHCEAGMRNALDLIHLAGKEGIPVACGREETDAFGNFFPQEWRDIADTLLNISIPPSSETPSPLNATDLLVNLINESPTKPVVVAIGPLTNLADLYQQAPEAASSIGHLYIMGGAVHVPGNILPEHSETENLVAEWNFYADPSSAAIVLNSDIPLTLISLDSCNQVPLNADFAARVAADHDHPVAEFVHQVLELNSEFVHSNGWFFWDVLASAIALDEKIATFDFHPIHVPVAPRAIAGQTAPHPDGLKVRIAEQVDAPAFYDDFVNTLNGRA